MNSYLHAPGYVKFSHFCGSVEFGLSYLRETGKLLDSTVLLFASNSPAHKSGKLDGDVSYHFSDKPRINYKEYQNSSAFFQ